MATRPERGIEFVVAVQSNADPENAESSETLKNTSEILKGRLMELDTRFYIDPDPDGYLIVKVPHLGELDLLAVKHAITKAGIIEFRLVHSGITDRFDLPDETRGAYEEMSLPDIDGFTDPSLTLWVKRIPEITGEMIERASARPDGNGSYLISLEFTKAGRVRLKDVTRMMAGYQRNTGRARRMAIVIDGRLVSAPTVTEEIIGGHAQISGRFTYRDASELTTLLNNPMQVRLQIVEEREFGTQELSANGIE